MTTWREFVSQQMKSRPTGMAPKDYFRELGQRWRSMKSKNDNNDGDDMMPTPTPKTKSGKGTHVPSYSIVEIAGVYAVKASDGYVFISPSRKACEDWIEKHGPTGTVKPKKDHTRHRTRKTPPVMTEEEEELISANENEDSMMKGDKMPNAFVLKGRKYSRKSPKVILPGMD
jgi:hypothetical protein